MTRQDVRMLSILQPDETVNTGKCDWKIKKAIMKPRCIVNYSSKMGAADSNVMLLSYVQYSCKSMK
jgi:hypothetical protein